VRVLSWLGAALVLSWLGGALVLSWLSSAHLLSWLRGSGRLSQRLGAHALNQLRGAHLDFAWRIRTAENHIAVGDLVCEEPVVADHDDGAREVHQRTLHHLCA
jgi:hypothetical protein